MHELQDGKGGEERKNLKEREEWRENGYGWIQGRKEEKPCDGEKEEIVEQENEIRDYVKWSGQERGWRGGPGGQRSDGAGKDLASLNESKG